MPQNRTRTGDALARFEQGRRDGAAVQREEQGASYDDKLYLDEDYRAGLKVGRTAETHRQIRASRQI